MIMKLHNTHIIIIKIWLSKIIIIQVLKQKSLLKHGFKNQTGLTEPVQQETKYQFGLVKMLKTNQNRN